MALDVWLHDRCVGRLSDEPTGLRFQYSADAFGRPEGARLSVRLPVRQKPFTHDATSAFFENLLPDEDVRALLATATRFAQHDTVALLGAVGGECAGAVSLWPPGVTPPLPAYVRCRAEDVPALTGRADAAGVSTALRQGRQSMSGAQEKLVFLRRGERYWLPRAGSPTTVLVKRSRERFPGLLHNEHLAMRLMGAAGVPVAKAQPCALDPRLYECVRYDRVVTKDGVTRLHQEDFCQATGRSSRAKYASTGGPSLSDLRVVLDRHSADALEDVRHLARWVVANLCLGNFDAHAKNLSLLTTREARSRLAPFYDVVCTAAYAGLDQEFALRVGGAMSIGALSPNALPVLARELKLARSELALVVGEVCAAVLGEAEDAAHDVTRTLGTHAVLETVVRWVRKAAPEVRRRLLGRR